MQRALHRQPDSQADRADGGDDRGSLHAELAEHHDHHENKDGVADKFREELPERRVEAAHVAEAGPDGTLGNAGDTLADNKQYDGAEHRERIGDDQRAELGDTRLDAEQGVFRVDWHDDIPLSEPRPQAVTLAKPAGSANLADPGPSVSAPAS